jgi:hypothetical protein
MLQVRYQRHNSQRNKITTNLNNLKVSVVHLLSCSFTFEMSPFFNLLLVWCIKYICFESFPRKCMQKIKPYKLCLVFSFNISFMNFVTFFMNQSDTSHKHLKNKILGSLFIKYSLLILHDLIHENHCLQTNYNLYRTAYIFM